MPSERTPHLLEMYEACCQRPDVMARALATLHGGSPRALLEDFCGSGAVSREWCRVAGRSAVGTDIDEKVVAYARERAGGSSATFRVMNVLDIDGAQEEPGDVVFVGNFSIGEIGDRRTLVAYLRRCALRLRRSGIMVCDLFGAPPRHGTGCVRRMVEFGEGTSVEYLWEQRSWEAWTARVVCAVHFRVIERGEVVAQYPEAFVYKWRVWGAAEFAEAMDEAGFQVQGVVDAVTLRTPDADAGAVCVLGRV